MLYKPTRTVARSPVEPIHKVDQPRIPEQPKRPMRPYIMTPDDVQPVRHVQPITIVHPATIVMPETRHVAEPKPSKISANEPSETIPETIPNKPEKQFGNNSPNNSETIHEPNSLAPTEQAPQAGSGGYKKKGQVGRKRKYEEVGNNGEIPVKKVVIFRHVKGRHWPGMSQDMQEWYNKYYFTKPKKTGKAEDHARHVKSYERGQRWIAEHEGRDYQPGALGHSGKIVAYRKRATS